MKVPINISLDYMDYINYYTYFLETKSDPRTSKWFLIGSPGPVLTIIATYLYFCIYAGPRYMKDRKPFDLKNAIIVYNFLQVIFSIFLVYEGLMGGWATGYSLKCQPVDYSDNPMALRMAQAVWLYFLCKIIELLDTVFFVLRKKMNQVTFLHLYHHAMMPICSWIGVKFLPGGHGTLLGLINSFIHIIMYSYYFVSSMGPQYQKYLWWKKHLTAMQMVQFCIIFFHNLQVLFRQCDYPKFIVMLLGTQALFFLFLFGSFYHKTYIQKPKALEKTNNNVQNGKTKVN
ncbi:elongation of very long chain fatty acids protein AAEL008004-like [Tribolium madens]|uniref:elongation of very long chain fatty acids protein AAEL008004-like n=1 Tax=Tribolium madens TaxID=41895 RepID=UPI001CF758B2|nr:elongation of very long chain fatty acids protein AAEL008004-like [Tribolium madens]XP_044261231.1 elongation of very long chain fatty acids protein AAEL008004-like [Tribolium madens]XP_044261239.1 elongation of very long chain fatty acids protein AAEL008004-like [Tribolium madens]XP_044261247.1 elongation of very long chain fatty acids protein AAEL008004-like [Tribolium madens]XP_044261257.1 elongation of very long chain fatty acids protein AAEL008004-like [Tribolium madens]XP_044261266.1 